MLSVEFIFRIIGAIGAAIGGSILGNNLAVYLEVEPDAYVIVIGLVGFLIGLILTPYVTIRPVRHLRHNLATMASGRLVAIITGLFLGLIAAALISLPLSLLPSPFRQILPLGAAVVFCYFSIIILTSRQQDLQAIASNFRPLSIAAPSSDLAEGSSILLDTSVIIDGRIADISKTGFIRGELLIPRFVLLELQHIADSSDSLRRNRGRRGLEILSIMQNESPIPVTVTEADVSDAREVDTKLVALGKHMRCPIMTNDYNLNRVAELQGVSVLNINDLANSVKAAFLPGEELHVKIIQDGKEPGQGVGYLEDGTMVVVENGNRRMHKTLNVTVTKVLQTTAGRMIFARM
ncbi:MAG: PIN/TRAM domain-containing protein [Anaerolineae bacterium]